MEKTARKLSWKTFSSKATTQNKKKQQKKKKKAEENETPYMIDSH